MIFESNVGSQKRGVNGNFKKKKNIQFPLSSPLLFIYLSPDFKNTVLGIGLMSFYFYC